MSMTRLRSAFLFLILVLIVVATAGVATAQSTWRPNLQPRTPKPNDFPPKVQDIRPLPDYNFMRNNNLDGKKAKSPDKAATGGSAAAYDTVMTWFNLSDWRGVFVPVPRLTSGFSMDQGGGGAVPVLRITPREPDPDEQARLPHGLRAPHDFPYAISAYAEVNRPALTAFTDIFLAEELNARYDRNHEALDWTTGYGASFRTSLGGRWDVQGHLDLARGRISDRQTWTSGTDAAAVVRDEQIIEIRHGALGGDLVYGGDWNATRWSLFAGAELIWGKIIYDYYFDGAQDFYFASDYSLAAAGRVGGSVVTAVTSHLGLRLTSGYRFAGAMDLESGDRAWNWRRVDGTDYRAKLELSGAYLLAGLEYGL